MLSPIAPTVMLGLSLLICIILLMKRADEPLPGEAGRVTNPSILVAVGLMSLGASAVAWILQLFTEASGEGLILQGLFAIMGLVLVQAARVPCIRYGPEGFTVRTYFGRIHECRWSDIRYIRDAMARDKWLVTQEGTFFLDGDACGIYAFLLYAAACMPDHQLPRQQKKPPFGLNRALPSGTLSGAWVLTVSTLLLLCCLGWLLAHPLEESELEARTVVFERMSKSLTGEYTLYAEDMRYKVRLDRAERDAFISAARAGNPFHIMLRMSGKAEDAYGQIWRIQDEGGHVYLSFARALERDQRLGWWMTGLCAGIPVVNWAYVAFVVQVGKHPERFDERLVAWCFREKKKTKGKRVGLRRSGV